MIQTGGYSNIFRGQLYQQGYGLGGYFRRFFKWIVPLAQKHALPVLEDGAKTIGRQAINSISNIAHDVVSGKNIQNSINEHGKNAIENIKTNLENKLEGRGIKRKKKVIFLKKPKQKIDIFSEN